MPSVRDEFKLELKNRFSVLSTQNADTDTEESWKAIYIETSEKILGFRKDQQKEWISEETWKENRKKKISKRKFKQ
jgi:hypothetical protein